jgi:uncharacterized membrane protein (DUF4010 family)
LLGGLISSTNVTWSFARASRLPHGTRLSLAYGVIAACTMLYLRMAIATAVLRVELTVALWPFLTLPFLIGAATVILGTRHLPDEQAATDAPRNPLQVVEALQMAAVFQIVLVAIELVRRWGGETGVVASGAVLGLTDVDALTLSMARDAAIPVEVAARALAVGIIANTALKIGIAVAVGAPAFRRTVALSLTAMIVAILAAWLLA